LDQTEELSIGENIHVLRSSIMVETNSRTPYWVSDHIGCLQFVKKLFTHCEINWIFDFKGKN